MNNLKTVFVSLCDSKYFDKAKQTITELRIFGKWNGQIILIVVGELSNDPKFFSHYNVLQKSFPKIDTSVLLSNIGPEGFRDSIDKREIHKLNQWEKFHVFDDYFRQWKRVVFLDAGMRIFDNVKYLLELDYDGAILAPNDAGPYLRADKIFSTQVSFDKPELIAKIKADFSPDILESHYFLNCLWIYDTAILDICNKNKLVWAMNEYPLCKTNEMTIMNLLFRNVWREFPIKASNKKYLFEWCETNHPHPTTWRDYCCMKYPMSQQKYIGISLI